MASGMKLNTDGSFRVKMREMGKASCGGLIWNDRAEWVSASMADSPIVLCWKLSCGQFMEYSIWPSIQDDINEIEVETDSQSFKKGHTREFHLKTSFVSVGGLWEAAMPRSISYQEKQTVALIFILRWRSTKKLEPKVILQELSRDMMRMINEDRAEVIFRNIMFHFLFFCFAL